VPVTIERVTPPEAKPKKGAKGGAEAAEKKDEYQVKLQVRGRACVCVCVVVVVDVVGC
jgi:hypothetical protein